MDSGRAPAYGAVDVKLALGVPLIVLLSGALSVEPPSPPLFSPGQKYVFAWECLPEFLAQAVSQAMAAGQAVNPCYVEELVVQAVRSDGWLLVTDDSGTGWTVNPARAIGFKVAQRALRAGH